MGTTKARDVIPGWPRGKSTATTLRLSLVRDFVLFGRVAMWPGNYGAMDELAFWEDIKAERMEERRKAVMIEQWYRFQRPLVSARELALFGFTTQDHPTPTLTAGRDPEPVLCEEERRKEKD